MKLSASVSVVIILISCLHTGHETFTFWRKVFMNIVINMSAKKQCLLTINMYVKTGKVYINWSATDWTRRINKNHLNIHYAWTISGYKKFKVYLHEMLTEKCFKIENAKYYMQCLL